MARLAPSVPGHSPALQWPRLHSVPKAHSRRRCGTRLAACVVEMATGRRRTTARRDMMRDCRRCHGASRVVRERDSERDCQEISGRLGIAKARAASAASTRSPAEACPAPPYPRLWRRGSGQDLFSSSFSCAASRWANRVSSWPSRRLERSWPRTSHRWLRPRPPHRPEEAPRRLRARRARRDRGDGEYDLEGLFVRLGHAIDAIGAKRVVLDTIESLFAGLSNSSVLRAELPRLFRWLKDRR